MVRIILVTLLIAGCGAGARPAASSDAGPTDGPPCTLWSASSLYPEGPWAWWSGAGPVYCIRVGDGPVLRDTNNLGWHWSSDAWHLPGDAR